jgi:hypothetical protein
MVRSAGWGARSGAGGWRGWVRVRPVGGWPGRDGLVRQSQRQRGRGGCAGRIIIRAGHGLSLESGQVWRKQGRSGRGRWVGGCKGVQVTAWVRGGQSTAGGAVVELDGLCGVVDVKSRSKDVQQGQRVWGCAPLTRVVADCAVGARNRRFHALSVGCRASAHARTRAAAKPGR